MFEQSEGWFSGDEAPLTDLPSEEDFLVPPDVPPMWETAGYEDEAGWIDALAAGDPLLPPPPAETLVRAENGELGPDLLRELAALDAERLSDAHLVAAAAGWQRVEHYAAARKLAAIGRFAGERPSGRPTESFLGLEIAAALSLGDGHGARLIWLFR